MSDLTRELYEALAAAESYIERDGESRTLELVREALRRFEQEVGDG